MRLEWYHLIAIIGVILMLVVIAALDVYALIALIVGCTLGFFGKPRIDVLMKKRTVKQRFKRIAKLKRELQELEQVT